jgi:adenylate cyclase
VLPLPDKPSIVVLPFDNMSKDPEHEYFSNGITEVLTADLSRISSLFVIARNTAFTYKGKATDVQAIGRELGVRYALEGSVQKTSEQVRIVAQLIDATTGGHLWSERYDRPLKDLFALQDDIVQKIVTTLKLQLTLQEQGWVMHKTTDNLEAYDAFLRAHEYCYSGCTKETNAKGRQLYEKAVALDPRYAEAYAALGATYLFDWVFQWSQDPQTLQRASELTQKAVALDDAVPRAHLALALVSLSLKQYDQAISSAERAIALDPNFADGYALGLAEVYIAVGRSAEVVGLVEKAMRLNPRAPFLYFFTLGRAYRLLGRSEEAIAALKEVLARNPNHLFSHFQLAGIYSELGREEEARAAAAAVLRLNPNYSLEVWRQRVYFKDPTLVDRWFAAARKAGLK